MKHTIFVILLWLMGIISCTKLPSTTFSLEFSQNTGLIGSNITVTAVNGGGNITWSVALQNGVPVSYTVVSSNVISFILQNPGEVFVTATSNMSGTVSVADGSVTVLGGVAQGIIDRFSVSIEGSAPGSELYNVVAGSTYGPMTFNAEDTSITLHFVGEGKEPLSFQAGYLVEGENNAGIPSLAPVPSGTFVISNNGKPFEPGALTVLTQMTDGSGALLTYSFQFFIQCPASTLSSGIFVTGRQPVITNESSQGSPNWFSVDLYGVFQSAYPIVNMWIDLAGDGTFGVTTPIPLVLAQGQNTIINTPNLYFGTRNILVTAVNQCGVLAYTSFQYDYGNPQVPQSFSSANASGDGDYMEFDVASIGGNSDPGTNVTPFYAQNTPNPVGYSPVDFSYQKNTNDQSLTPLQIETATITLTASTNTSDNYQFLISVPVLDLIGINTSIPTGVPQIVTSPNSNPLGNYQTGNQSGVTEGHVYSGNCTVSNMTVLQTRQSGSDCITGQGESYYEEVQVFFNFSCPTLQSGANGIALTNGVAYADKGFTEQCPPAPVPPPPVSNPRLPI